MKKTLFLFVSLLLSSTITNAQVIWDFNSHSITGFEKASDSDYKDYLKTVFTGPGLDSLFWTEDPTNPANGVMALAIHWDSIGQHGRMELGSGGNATFFAPGGAKFITFWVYLDSAQKIPDSLQIDTYAETYNPNWTWIEDINFVKDIPHNKWYPLSFQLAAHKVQNPNFNYDAGFISGLQVFPHSTASTKWHGIIYVDNVSLVENFVMDKWSWMDARSGPHLNSGIGIFPTGVHVVTGDSIHIMVTGMWWCGNLPDPWWGPNGESHPQPYLPLPILPDISEYALVGGIGVTSDEHFRTPLVGGNTGVYGPGYVGSNFLGVATDSGQIYLAMNDEPLNDNQGGFYVTITVTHILTGVLQQRPFTPLTYALSQNYPNPFNPSTTIRYALPNHSSVRLVITNTLGQEVAVLENGEQEAGYHEVEWRGNVASGIYFYRIEAVNTTDPNNRFVQVKKMLLLK